MTALEVWGDPIAHSLSPALHNAAYARLGWDWTYGRRRVGEADFARELSALSPDIRGLSCTMPLKALVHAAADERDARAELTGAANTLLFTDGRRRAFNTDVGGIIAALEDAGLRAPASARIVGAGATATSALVALAEWGVGLVDVVARRPEAVAPLRELGERLGVTVDGAPLTARGHRPHPLTLATLPGDAPIARDVAEGLAVAGGVLFDVVYGHWPTALASAWQAAGLPAHSGEGMLLRQAVLQIRIFATGDVLRPLPEEEAVVAVMRRALVGG